MRFGKLQISSKSIIRTVMPVVLLTVFFILAGTVLASTDFGLQEAQQIGLGDRDLKEIITNIINIALGFLGVVAVIIILYAGFQWMTAGGNEEKVQRAKKILVNAVIGLIIIISAYAIAAFVISRLSDATNTGTSSRGDTPNYNYSGGLAGGIIRYHYPARGAINIPRNISIVITFKEEMDASTIINNGRLNIDNIQIVDGENNQVDEASAVTEDNLTYVITPDDYLGNDDTDTRYLVTLGSGVLKANGSPAFGATGSYDWQFTTSTELDITPPQITSIFPRPDTVNPRNSVIQINFSEPINPLSASGSTDSGFNKITADGSITGLVSGDYTISNQYQTVEFLTNDLCGMNSCGFEVYCLPASETISMLVKAATLLEAGKPTAVVPFDGIVDMALNSLDGNADSLATGPTNDNYQWNFDTNDNIDLSPPTVKSVTPGVSANNITTRALVKAEFDKLMMTSTLTADNIMIDGNIPYWIINRNNNNKTDSYIAHDEFLEFSTYHPLINNKCKDIYQNCFDPASGPTDLKVGGSHPDYGWIQGSTNGEASISGNNLTLANNNAPQTGAWESPAIDMGESVEFTGFYSLGTVPVGTLVTIKVRAANSQAELENQTWKGVAFDGYAYLNNSRWLQVRVELNSSQADTAPTVNNISINYK